MIKVEALSSAYPKAVDSITQASNSETNVSKARVCFRRTHPDLVVLKLKEPVSADPIRDDDVYQRSHQHGQPLDKGEASQVRRFLAPPHLEISP